MFADAGIILDCLLSIISKALSVQVKAKGRFPNVLQSLVGDTSTTAVTLLSLLNPKPVMGESTVRMQRWYMRGPMSQEVAFEVVKLKEDVSCHVGLHDWHFVSPEDSKAKAGYNERCEGDNKGKLSEIQWKSGINNGVYVQGVHMGYAYGV